MSGRSVRFPFLALALVSLVASSLLPCLCAAAMEMPQGREHCEAPETKLPSLTADCRCCCLTGRDAAANDERRPTIAVVSAATLVPPADATAQPFVDAACRPTLAHAASPPVSPPTVLRV